MRLCVGDAGALDVSDGLINTAYVAKLLMQSVMRHTFIHGAEDSHLNATMSCVGISEPEVNPLLFPHWNSKLAVHISFPHTFMDGRAFASLGLIQRCNSELWL